MQTRRVNQPHTNAMHRPPVHLHPPRAAGKRIRPTAAAAAAAAAGAAAVPAAVGIADEQAADELCFAGA